MQNYKIFTHDELEKDDKQLKVHVKSTQAEIDFLIGLLKEQIKQEKPSFGFLVETCYNLVGRLPIPVHYYKDTFILRARPNDKGEIFKWANEISYNSACPQDSKLSRFNQDGEAVFYGTVPISSAEANGALTTICESYKDMFNPDNKEIRKYFTLGKWMIKKPITLLMLTFYDIAIKNSIHIRNINPAYEDFLNKAFDEEDRNKLIGFFNFFSEYAGRRNDTKNNYLLTTAFYHAARRYYGEDIGICYSSSMTENKGLNIVITKDVVDTSLKLDTVLMYKVERDPGADKTYKVLPCSIPVSVEKNGRFRILGVQ